MNLPELIADCSSELASLFEERNINLIIEQPNATLRLGGDVINEVTNRRDAESAEDAQRLEIRADERMLRQSLLNIIRNAAEAISEKQTVRRVEVLSSNERDNAGRTWAVVEIKDSGEGIPASDLQRIFIPFFTTKATGHGVGLALAHRVITQHGGTLTASNAKGGGAVFTIQLPL